mmetsp:Transcript_54513/g.70068  ORF Transcript_54513/g.70068 Transcript_54513/m.70068 type:complete len:464 (+) Transcript_54513:23-1414(+)
MEDPIATPRKEIVNVPKNIFEESEALIKNGKLREAVVIITRNQQHHQDDNPGGLPPICVDAGQLVYNSMIKLRENPWLVLSLKESDNLGDKEIRKAFRELALKLHPDKSGFNSTDIFACVYAAYESIETDAKRKSFNQKREEEILQRQAAKAAGPRAEKELEKKYAKERVRQEKESFKKWRSVQQETFIKWEKNDIDFKNQLDEKDRNDRRREYLEKERKKRGNKLEVAKQTKRDTIRKNKSENLQKKLQAEEDEARSMIAALEKEKKILLAARRKDKGEQDVIKALVPSTSSSNRKSISDNGKTKISTTKSTTIRKTSSSSSSTSLQNKNSINKTKQNFNNLQIIKPGQDTGKEEKEDDGEKTFEVSFKRKGPMGFTLIDNEIKPQSTNDLWSASVLKLEFSPDAKGKHGTSVAADLGVEAGDVLIAINGYETKGMMFPELCSFLGKAAYPRSLSFLRRAVI